ncbi:MAG: hypothetical protein CME06_01530 [Gemmatimonadetes bacterium]|nr:hypothetical protein [Gemmatimonadota bacterium]
MKLSLAGRLAPTATYKLLYSVPRNSVWDAFLCYSPDERFNLTVGQFKVPFSAAGLAFANAAPGQKTVRGPRIYGTHPGSPTDSPRISSRDVGFALGGDLLGGRCRYALGAFNGAGINTGDDNDAKDRLARVLFQPFRGTESALSHLRLGGAYWMIGDQPAEGEIGKKRERVSGLVEISAAKLTLQSEYINQQRERIGSDLRTWSWYTLASYEIGTRITVVVRYEQYDPDGDTAGDQERLSSLGANCHLNEHIAIRANFNLYDEESTDVDNNELLVQLDMRL